MENSTIGIQLIATERQKQITKHGFTGEHHVNHPEWYEKEQLIKAAVALLLPIGLLSDLGWPEIPENWDAEWFEDLMQRSHKERLIISAALLSAELDRIEALEK